ncbi:MAG: response regulator [Chlorobi bacterium]|nr:response regulator [Chlorobiota bacterium]
MLKVLLVDDDPSITMFVERLLVKKFACSVRIAHNGLEGLNKIKEDKPDIVFLDLTMPVMDGLEMLEALRKDPSTETLPVVMLTAVSDIEVVRKTTEKGVISYLLKPLMYETTYEKLKELFQKLRTMQQSETKDKIGETKIDSLDPKKILVVEKDAKFRETFAEQMRGRFEVLQAEDGAEGLKIFLRELPQAVCLGENLPTLNEILLAKKIRSIKKDEKVTIFAIRSDKNLKEEEKGLYDLVIPRREDGTIQFPQ